MPQTVPDGAVFFRHNPDKVIPNQIRMNAIFFSIKWWCSEKRSLFWGTEGLEWMGMCFVSSIPYFDKYSPFPILSNDIDFSTFELIVSPKDGISWLDEVPTSNIFSCIADTSARNLYFLFCHGEEEANRKIKCFLLLPYCFILFTKRGNICISIDQYITSFLNFFYFRYLPTLSLKSSRSCGPRSSRASA